MLHIAYYEADVKDFCTADPNAVLGELANRHGFALESRQKFAWQEQIAILQAFLTNVPGQIYFEFSIPRMGKRADVILVSGGVVFVVEFKVGSDTFDRAAIEQVHDYALDLKNFHKGSHHCQILPVLIATGAPTMQEPTVSWDSDGVAKPVCINPFGLTSLITTTLAQNSATPINPAIWSRSGYHPTPTIVEAAQALYRDHDIKDISRSDTCAQNLSHTSDCISQILVF